MRNTVLFLFSLLLACLLGACASTAPVDPVLLQIDQARLPAPDRTVHIPGLGPCTDSPDRSLQLASNAPLTVLVHGCFSSAGRFRGLAQVLAFHGQQSACFTYNDRDSLVSSADALRAALDQLGKQMPAQPVAVIGHSQGALIARKAMVADAAVVASAAAPQLRLVTVSGPFAGIAAANTCGNAALRTLSLGIVGAICQAVTGDKWPEITRTSPFIVAPGQLGPQVRQHLKIVTDERGSCRRRDQGRCAESDDIFSLAEQRNRVVDSDPAVQVIEVQAGHVEIVGDNRVAPVKLIDILQAQGLIGPTAPERVAQLEQLLGQLYGGSMP